ncbi:GNAT family N-acetyltransferase [Sutcliffiella sp. NPDC057660]|uniref:GNAT family N-acetyltransferase n=1 Tax=Sutcliffiella sp. NPDC057660 TaxID=3346199 RepID=UPI00369C2C81
MNLHITKETDDKKKRHVNKMLYEYNLQHFPEDLRGRYQEINLYLMDEEDNVRGGLLGEVCWNWLEIHILMIDEDLRKDGYGSKLMLEAERLAVENKCDFIKVDTLSFQALDFYKKHGYEVYGILDQVGRDHEHYFLRKLL